VSVSTIAALSTDIIERDVAAGERPLPERSSWLRQDEVNNQATAVTFLQDRKEWLLAAYKKLSKLALLEADWDSYGAEAPTRDSIDAAREILRALADAELEPTSVDPSAEGGVCLSFQRGGRYGDIECFNSGGILAVTSTGPDDTNVWEIERSSVQLGRALSRIRTFIGW